MKKAKKSLIAIDMLYDFLERDGALYCGNRARRIIPFVKKTIERFRTKRNLVIYSSDSHKPGEGEFGLFGRHCMAGTKGAEIIKEVKPQKTDLIIPKSTYDSAFRTDLIRTLKRHRIKDVFLVGICTSICIMETASSLAKEGFRVNILRRGVADFDEKTHASALKRMKTVYGANII